jgi:N-acyl-D-amino-acid deacylase
MPRKCTVCEHEKVEEINRLLLKGVSLRNIAKQYFVSAASLHRHKKGHLPAKLVKAQEALDILIKNSMQVGIIRHSMSESDLVAAMRHPRTCIVTDGTIGVESEGKIHPRSIGTYARFLGHFVRDKKVLPMAEAIRKITSLPAAKMRIHDRGLLREGLAADLVIFDPDKIADRSTYQDPWHSPDGIPGVFVNGQLAVWEGELTGVRPGRLLKKL